MAYPLIPLPTRQEFERTLLDACGCTLEILPVQAISSIGERLPLRRLTRTNGSQTYRCPWPAQEPTEHLLPQYLRYVCRRLAIDPARFGLTLG